MNKYERITDNRIGKGWYQPKDREETKELLQKADVSVKDLYERLREYEDLGLSPDEIREFIQETRKQVDSLLSYQTFYARLKAEGIINEDADVQRIIDLLEKENNNLKGGEI